MESTSGCISRAWRSRLCASLAMLCCNTSQQYISRNQILSHRRTERRPLHRICNTVDNHPGQSPSRERKKETEKKLTPRRPTYLTRMRQSTSIHKNSENSSSPTPRAVRRRLVQLRYTVRHGIVRLIEEKSGPRLEIEHRLYVLIPALRQLQLALEHILFRDVLTKFQDLALGCMSG